MLGLSIEHRSRGAWPASSPDAAPESGLAQVKQQYQGWTLYKWIIITSVSMAAGAPSSPSASPV